MRANTGKGTRSTARCSAGVCRGAGSQSMGCVAGDRRRGGTGRGRDAGTGRERSVHGTVEDQVRSAYQIGVSGVPTYVINERYAIVGAQPYEVFQNALGQILKQDSYGVREPTLPERRFLPPVEMTGAGVFPYQAKSTYAAGGVSLR
jgi:hypothetical protein